MHAWQSGSFNGPLEIQKLGSFQLPTILLTSKIQNQSKWIPKPPLKRNGGGSQKGYQNNSPGLESSETCFQQNIQNPP